MTTEFKFPDVGEGITEGTLLKWHVNEGDEIKTDQTIAEVETEKAVVELPSPVSGTVLKLNGKEGETIEVGKIIAVIGEKGETAEISETEEKKEEAPIEAAKPIETPTQPQSSGILATPATRKLAAELKVDLSKVNGTGTNGRVTDEDVRSAAKVTEKPKAPKVTFEKYGQILKIPLTSMRKAITEHMKLSRYTAPHSTLMDEIDATFLVNLRQGKKEEAKQRGVKLTYLPFIIKALIKSFKSHPYLNSSLDEEDQQIIVKSYYNIGIAVQTAMGLVVPVIRNADKKDIFELAKEIEELSQKAKDRKLSIEEMRGGSFTISNYGSIGVTFAVPVVNYPEVAILGIGKMQKKPVVIDDEIKIKPIIPVSVSFDHRVVDGGEVAKFINELSLNLQEDMTAEEEKHE